MLEIRLGMDCLCVERFNNGRIRAALNTSDLCRNNYRGPRVVKQPFHVTSVGMDEYPDQGVQESDLHEALHASIVGVYGAAAVLVRGFRGGPVDIRSSGNNMGSKVPKIPAEGSTGSNRGSLMRAEAHQAAMAPDKVAVGDHESQWRAMESHERDTGLIRPRIGSGHQMSGGPDGSVQQQLRDTIGEGTSSNPFPAGGAGEGQEVDEWQKGVEERLRRFRELRASVEAAVATAALSRQREAAGGYERPLAAVSLEAAGSYDLPVAAVTPEAHGTLEFLVGDADRLCIEEGSASGFGSGSRIGFESPPADVDESRWGSMGGCMHDVEGDIVSGVGGSPALQMINPVLSSADVVEGSWRIAGGGSAESPDQTGNLVLSEPSVNPTLPEPTVQKRGHSNEGSLQDSRSALDATSTSASCPVATVGPSLRPPLLKAGMMEQKILLHHGEIYLRSI